MTDLHRTSFSMILPGYREEKSFFHQFTTSNCSAAPTRQKALNTGKYNYRPVSETEAEIKGILTLTT